MSKIYRDDHSLYVKTNGSYYRPVLTHLDNYDINGNVKRIDADFGTSVFTCDSKVKVKMVRYASICSVKSEEVTEYWHTHGEYKDWEKEGMPIIPSNEQWKPYIK